MKKEFIEKFIEGISYIDKSKVNIVYLTKLKYDNLPKSIFKYCSVDEKNHNITNLKKDVIYMNSPLKFNDPYEFTFKIDGFSYIYNTHGITHVNWDGGAFDAGIAAGYYTGIYALDGSGV